MPECTTCARAPYNKESLVCQKCFDYTPLGTPIHKHRTKRLPANADRIRVMNDEELYKLFCGTASAKDHMLLEKLKDSGIDTELIEIPQASYKWQLAWLKQEVDKP